MNARSQELLWRMAMGEHARDDAAAPQLDERYAAITRLDAGASAAVWQAYDRKLGRHVAIKVFHEAHAHAAALAEARAACDVISDHVVRVLDVHAGYIVMELVGEHDPARAEQVPGASAAVVRPRSPEEAVRWVRDVARGVHDAHLRDVFHRDLKPHNVLITPVSRRARIGDFGLAASEAHFAGTPQYMAPEQARGLAAGRGERGRAVAIDVWGLGALAYDLLAGKPPWPGEDLDAWEHAAAGERPAPLEDVPPRLARVIGKALAAEPAQRYTSAAALGNELDAYLARRPTSLDRSRTLRAALFCRRNPQLSLTAGAALVLAGLTLAAYVTVVGLRARGHELASAVVAQEAANQELEDRIGKTRDELAKTETDLKARGQALASLERALSDEQTALHAIIDARDQALKTADAATKVLVDQLTVARSDRDAAELGRQMYEGFWTSARNERDQAVADRDKANVEQARLAAERDHAQADREKAAAERDAAVTQEAKVTAELDRVHAEITSLRTELADAAHAPASGAAAGSGSAAAPATTAATGAAHTGSAPAPATAHAGSAAAPHAGVAHANSDAAPHAAAHPSTDGASHTVADGAAHPDPVHVVAPAPATSAAPAKTTHETPAATTSAPPAKITPAATTSAPPAKTTHDGPAASDLAPTT